MKGHEKKRLDQITGLKVIAVLLIFWWHTPIPNPEVDLGARACEFFFVCSGFLMAYNYNEKKMPATFKCSVLYVAKKFAMMWPLHFMTFVLRFALAYKDTGLHSYTIWTVLLNLSLLQSWSTNLDTVMSYNGLSWFISTILFCYFMAPFLLKIANKMKSPKVGFILTAILRVWLDYAIRRYPDILFNFNTHVHPIVRCIEFVMGIFVAFIVKELMESRSKEMSQTTVSILEIVTVIAVLTIAIVYANKFTRSMYALICCAIVFVFAQGRGIVSSFLKNRVFLWLGKYEFEIYITHNGIMRCITFLFRKHSFVYRWPYISVCTFVCVLIFAVIYKKFFEKTLVQLVKNGMNFVTNSLFRVKIV